MAESPFTRRSNRTDHRPFSIPSFRITGQRNSFPLGDDKPYFVADGAVMRETHSESFLKEASPG
jgi:hypothetical protein